MPDALQDLERHLIVVAHSPAIQSVNSEESWARTTAHTAYYWAFHQAIRFALAGGFLAHRNGGDHRRVWEWLQSNGWMEACELGIDLHRWRKLADYQPERPFTVSRGDLLIHARTLVESLGQPCLQYTLIFDEPEADSG